MYRGVFILSENVKNKEEAYGFLSGESMYGGMCTESNKRIARQLVLLNTLTGCVLLSSGPLCHTFGFGCF